MGETRCAESELGGRPGGKDFNLVSAEAVAAVVGGASAGAEMAAELNDAFGIEMRKIKTQGGTLPVFQSQSGVERTEARQNIRLDVITGLLKDFSTIYMCDTVTAFFKIVRLVVGDVAAISVAAKV